MSHPTTDTPQSFWEHLDDLRACLIKVVVVVVALGITAFVFKEQLFAVILGPQENDFITYRLLNKLAGLWGETTKPFTVELINTGLARQFTAHMTAAMYAATHDQRQVRKAMRKMTRGAEKALLDLEGMVNKYTR